MSWWQVDICWLVAFLRLSILYLHPYPTTYLPSLSELLNLEQFLHSVYRVGLWSVKIMVIQTKTTVGSVFASDDGRVLWPLSCRQWTTVESNDSGCSVGKELIPGQWRVFSNCDIDIRNIIIADTTGWFCSCCSKQKSKKDILFSRIKNKCKKSLLVCWSFKLLWI